MQVPTFTVLCTTDQTVEVHALQDFIEYGWEQQEIEALADLEIGKSLQFDQANLILTRLH